MACENLLARIHGQVFAPGYNNGHGTGPMTVEDGGVVSAEFGHGGNLLPGFPVDNAVPSGTVWVLKRHLLPLPYSNWYLMFKGREWLTAAVFLEKV